jgi:2-keto-3-deoxy-L-rhamnonate aldolase RhmA
MKKLSWMLLSAALCAGAVGVAVAQNVSPNAADPYANNAAAGTLQFPLAAKAGQDSGAARTAPAGAVNTGAINPSTWRYGPNGRPPAGGSPIWNPVMVKMKEGGKVTGATAFSTTDPETYCALANAGYDFIWTEMQHNTRDWNEAARMWAACPKARAVPGTRIAFADEREEQHALDAGALVLVVPTIRDVAEGQKARDFAFFPPAGKRSSGGGQGSAFWANVPGGYRNTINDNLVLILMIETISGIADADKIAALPGVTAVFAASGDLGNHSGYSQGSPDYERLINVVHDAALKAKVRLCGPLAWRDRPDFTCFQAGSETALIAAGARQELGPLLNTQGRPTVGPWAPGGEAYIAPNAGGRGGRGGGRGAANPAAAPAAR